MTIARRGGRNKKFRWDSTSLHRRIRTLEATRIAEGGTKKWFTSTWVGQKGSGTKKIMIMRCKAKEKEEREEVGERLR